MLASYENFYGDRLEVTVTSSWLVYLFDKMIDTSIPWSFSDCVEKLLEEALSSSDPDSIDLLLDDLLRPCGFKGLDFSGYGCEGYEGSTRLDIGFYSVDPIARRFFLASLGRFKLSLCILSRYEDLLPGYLGRIMDLVVREKDEGFAEEHFVQVLATGLDMLFDPPGRVIKNSISGIVNPSKGSRAIV